MATIQGDLSEYPIPDLLQFMHSTRKGGQLVLEGAAAVPAGIYFSEGQVVHAYCPPRKGVQALYQLLSWQEGRFAFLKNVAPAERTIFDDLQNLLLEGLRRLDEYRALADRLPPPGTILHLARTEDRSTDDLRLTRREWRVLAQVNGRRTLDEVLHLAGGEEGESARTVYGLLLAGLVTTARDDTWLGAIVPARVPAEEAPPTRAAPPTILANLLLKNIDGARSLRELLDVLGCGERALADELHLLVRTGWARIRAGEDLYARYLAG
jgi:Domain of unknown function (DUF4388)